MQDILISCNLDTYEQKDNFLNDLIRELESMHYRILYSDSVKDGLSTLENNAQIVSYIFDWDSFDINEIEQFATINPDLPIFVTYFTKTDLDLELSNFKLNLGFLQYDKHLIKDDSKRIDNAIKSYIDKILPPFTKGLMQYVEAQKYTFCTPGHMAGTAFTQSPVGSVFHQFYGDNVFKSDVSISVPELGSLLDHSGLHGEAEEYIAETFNADYSYIVTNGTSTANKVVALFAASQGDTVLIDRNCHKSICHFMMMVDVVPIYLKPTRNAYGILGGIPRAEFTEDSIKAKIANSPIKASWPTYAVITNSTYDGLLYNTGFIKDNLSIKHLHFDSAWTPYTHFHHIYENKYGMYHKRQDEQIIFETHSTHKLLAAFSQASMIHVKGTIDKEVMDECYMMHTSTSPLYQITASCEIAAAMVRGNRGVDLLDKVINYAINFRKEVRKLRAESDTWYFDVWQPEETHDKVECFELTPDAPWHGFKNQDAHHMYLDPVKVTILTPGIENSKLTDFGIPASIVSMYLDEHGIILEKSGPYSMLFLFTIGTTHAKSMKLLAVLNSFKLAFDENQLVKNMLPGLYKMHPEFYAAMRVQDLAMKIHNLMKQYNLPEKMYKAFDVLPHMEMTPYQAFQKLVKGQTKTIKMRDMEGQTSAVMVLPYPPGVPLIMPGEKITGESRNILDYLIMLEEIGLEVPGFESDIHGVERDNDNNFIVKVIE